ncbi:6-bladed beta-propeller [Cyclobacterium marinum]|uniref:6-bladed beta-propeller protein n=1 Tax=Cyclobacterium marinum (strain ATCC 25205 / DSM 745 / LMG 13164 / NCIMB 1802) TaxID=880070 RepID=G0J452_CYCMS|nr:6-bladed beta-propeller [Cyclobacterium marinum]AEL26718.1 hypothetical protein Cycma_2989 [Cyclobacterium marinum DSM 745]
MNFIRLITIFISFLTFSVGIICCGTKNEKHYQTKFPAINETLSNNYKALDINISNGYDSINPNEYIGQSFNFSDLINDYEYLPLKLKNDEVLGAIDKILFNDSLIVVLDKYFTKSINIFSRQSGMQLLSLASTGDGPSEFREIYDFDVDFEKQELFIHDGALRKIIKFDFSGQFISEKKVNFRMGNFKILPGERILNYTKHDPNDHLGSEAGFSELLITDANLRVEASAFPFTEEETLNDFYGRNYLDKKGDKVYIQPRFSEFIYEYIDSIQLLNPILKFKMEGRFLPEKETFKPFDEFEEKVSNEKLYFTNGQYFFTNNGWFGYRFAKLGYGIKEMMVFYNKNSKSFLGGDNFNMDINGLILFSFPINTYKDEGVGVIEPDVIKSITDENYIKMLQSNGKYGDKIKNLFREIGNDFDDQVLVFYKFK